MDARRLDAAASEQRGPRRAADRLLDVGRAEGSGGACEAVEVWGLDPRVWRQAGLRLARLEGADLCGRPLRETQPVRGVPARRPAAGGKSIRRYTDMRQI